MAEEAIKQKEMDLGPFTADERAYFDSKGEKDIPAPMPTPAAGEVPMRAPAPATASEPVPASEPKAPEPQGTVPQAALHEERKRRQEAEERARQIEILNARMEERFRAFRDAMTPRQQPQQAPDPDRDIFGTVKHMQAEQRQTRAEIENYKRQIQYEDQMRALRQWGSDAEAAYVRQNPDYYTALNHLRQARARELQVWGMQPSAIGQQLQHEENQLLARAAAERRNPAEMAHALARQRGYVAGAPPQRPAASGSTPANPQPYVDLNRIEAGQKQAASLSNVGGGTGRDTGDIEINDVLKMSDKEFETYINKHPAHFRRLKGAAH
jgi:hypothetical protein